MKKIWIFSILVLLLAGCTSTSNKDVAKIAREDNQYWWLEIEERGNENWYYNEDEGEFQY